eukprot:TRINITY_DN774_c0_g1_i1.p1 TRINITY_DN774_c0_g1~~TRINITY_DN774_c0_g1_i1.p1  ORF type:complete len:215 (-),score=55.26 TRINITY_DN774_c0_g1_i1:46-690(-)
MSGWKGIFFSSGSVDAEFVDVPPPDAQMKGKPIQTIHIEENWEDKADKEYRLYPVKYPEAVMKDRISKKEWKTILGTVNDFIKEALLEEANMTENTSILYNTIFALPWVVYRERQMDKKFQIARTQVNSFLDETNIDYAAKGVVFEHLLITYNEDDEEGPPSCIQVRLYKVKKSKSTTKETTKKSGKKKKKKAQKKKKKSKKKATKAKEDLSSD